jgi:hypothetical protein
MLPRGVNKGAFAPRPEDLIDYLTGACFWSSTRSWDCYFGAVGHLESRDLLHLGIWSKIADLPLPRW